MSARWMRTRAELNLTGHDVRMRRPAEQTYVSARVEWPRDCWIGAEVESRIDAWTFRVWCGASSTVRCAGSSTTEAGARAAAMRRVRVLIAANRKRFTTSPAVVARLADGFMQEGL